MNLLYQLFLVTIAAVACLVPVASGERLMERLGRGIVAVRSSNTDVFVSWRLLGLDPDDIAFNLYRATGSGSPVKLNNSPLTGGTNYVDRSADLVKSNTYTVRPVVGGKEQAVGGTFTLSANKATEPVIRVPIRGGDPIKFVWVGDLDGDGEYDFVLDRQASPQLLEAHRSDEQHFAWIFGQQPRPLAHWDGVTVYDFDSDGRAEVAVRIANGVTFGDGRRFDHNNDNEQFIAILDGRTGALRTRTQIPTDYISDGPMAARLGVGYLDGQHPSLVTYIKNRQKSGNLNLVMAAWAFDGTSLKMQWKWRRDNQDAPDGHNTRIIDVDGDGRDEIHEIGFSLNGDGKVRYLLGSEGIVHGDRFHIAKMDPTRAGLQGYGVQQRNPNDLLEYYYDATEGRILWRHFSSEETDVGRGMVSDIDPTQPGMEGSFQFWDGNILMELYNDGKIEKWNWKSPSTSGAVPRLLTTSEFGAKNSHGPNPAFHGDILGDWREQVILVSPENDELVIFTTDQPSDIRLYTLAHNPAYRNSMTPKGYVQSHHVDYFIGQGMAKPPRPNIRMSASEQTSGPEF